ncbi:MAG: type II toxin-antitoxin system VapC family toxin [Nitrospiraceae bacterium]
MKLIDLNILLYAVNEEAPHHGPVLAWWEQALNGDEPLGLPWVVVLGFLRIATNHDIFPRPLDPDTAIGTVHAWLSLDNTSLLREKDEHWEILRSLLSESGSAANLVTDAHLAALAISYGAVLISCDNDFARFKRLRWENPIGRKPLRRS